MSEIAQYKHILTQKKAKLEVLRENLNTMQARQDSAQKECEILEICNAFLASQISVCVDSVKYKLESIVNQGLSYVFNDNLRIAIESDFKNNKTQFSLKIFKDGVSEGLAESFGGGVLAIISLLLRVGTIIISKHERFMFLDESLSFVSMEYQHRIGEFLNKLCKELDFCIVLISHQDAINQYANISYIAQISNDSVEFKRVAHNA